MEKIQLDEIVHPELLVVDSEATNKAEILNELGTLLHEKGYIKNVRAFLDDVYLREEEGETGIGQGIAIPHGKSPAVSTTTVAIATLKEGIEWETLDEQEVKVVILFAVKDSDANTTHILLLQQIAILLANDQFIKQIKEVQTKEELFDLITNY